MCVFDWRAKTIAVPVPFRVAWQKCSLSTTPWEFPNKANHVRHTICQVLKHNGDEPSDCESSCPCYCSQIEGLRLHVVNITRYVIRITKHLYNRIEIIEIERHAIIEIELNHKAYESLHPYWQECAHMYYWRYGKMETINGQLVLQHCCKTSWNAMLHTLSPTNQPGLSTKQVVVNLICCTGLNVGCKTCNIATMASLKKVSFLFLSSKVYLERSVILFVF